MVGMTGEGVPALRSHSLALISALLEKFSLTLLSPEKCWPPHKLMHGIFFAVGTQRGSSCTEVMLNISKCDIFIFSSCGAHTTHNTRTSQV